MHSPTKRNVLQNKHKKLQPDLVTCYDIRPGNGGDYSYFGTS